VLALLDCVVLNIPLLSLMCTAFTAEHNVKNAITMKKHLVNFLKTPCYIKVKIDELL
jgi:hypothetical protein